MRVRIQPHDTFQIRKTKSIEQLDVPAEGRGGEGERGDGMADVVVAVPEGALSVLPGLPPEDGGYANEKGIGGKESEEGGRRELSAKLEGM